jgi:hypothetical protein
MDAIRPAVPTKPAPTKPDSWSRPLANTWRAAKANRKSLAYRALVLFSYVYFVRPEDFIPGLQYIPIGKITGGIALFALVFGSQPKDREKLPTELKVLALLLFHMLLTFVFASWHGGAFDMVVNRFSKGVIVAFLIYLVVSRIDELRKLLVIQATTIALITIASVIVHHTQDGRLMGIQKGILENPNDLAINIVISFPLCLAFLLAGKGAVNKVFWSFSMLVMIYAVIATYSRSGLIALVITCMICFWEFIVKAKRTALLVGILVVGVAGIGMVLATPSYMTRVRSIVEGNIAGSKDKGSLEARKQLLLESLSLTVHHPIFGVGPGGFPAASGTWQPTHNTYTGLSSEAGLPAVILFTIVMFMSLRKTKKAQKLPGYLADADLRLWNSALRAGMAAYIVGAMFATTEYNLFEYFIVGYICVLYKIASQSAQPQSPPPVKKHHWLREIKNGSNTNRELVRTR